MSTAKQATHGGHEFVAVHASYFNSDAPFFLLDSRFDFDLRFELDSRLGFDFALAHQTVCTL